MKKKQYLLLVVLIVVAGLAFMSETAIAQKTKQQIARNAFPSVVLLVMEDEHGQPVSLGSGFFIRDGVIATNLHVVEGATRGYAKLVGKKPKHDIAGMFAIDSVQDLVLLSVTGTNAPSLPLGDSEKVSVGDEVYAVGNPQGLEGTFSQGIVSSVRNVGADTILQITAPISPGSSGGPVLNSNGEVIGVAVATFKEGQNLNFAIPASYISSLLLNTKAPTPLPGKTQIGQAKSILDDLGGRSTEGVIGTQFRWKYAFAAGNYSFSLRNKLREPVTNVYCLVVFHDFAGDPIDIDVIRCGEIIPAGLAKRVLSKIDESVQELTTRGRSKTPSTEIEFRILDFQIVE